jgi:hypothetical protein
LLADQIAFFNSVLSFKLHILKIISRIFISVALIVFFCWPAIYNGQPFLSPDTSAYIRGFDAGVVWLFDQTSVWTGWAKYAGSSWAAPTAAEQAFSLQSPGYIIAGRSVAYGAILYFSEMLGALWVTVAIQAGVAFAAIFLTLNRINHHGWAHIGWVAAALGLFTSFPFFVSFLLPDIFGALALLGIANLTAFSARMTGYERFFWFSILALSAIFHPSHLALILVVAIPFAMAWLAGAAVTRAGVLIILLSAGVGIAGELTFNLAIKKILGVPVSRPPVIAARIIADGPGAAYLRANCPAAGLVLCGYLDQLALPNSDAFLWYTTEEGGVYKSASTEKKREMALEQYRFAAAVLAFDPIGQLRASLKNSLEQLTMIGLTGFTDPAPNLPDSYAQRRADSAAGRGAFPFSFFSMLTSFVVISSVLFLAFVSIRRWKTVSFELKLFCALLIVGQLANALICGVLSGPHDRYQARLAWLLPFAALLVHYETRDRKPKLSMTVSA